MVSTLSEKKFYPWLVVGLLWFVALLNYLDRQMLSTMKPSMMLDIKELATAENFGRLMAVFLWITLINSGGLAGEYIVYGNACNPTQLQILDRGPCDAPQAKLGNTQIYSSVNASYWRRAMPVTFCEDNGEIQSISIYHNGGTGNMLLGVYADNSGSPGSLLGVTPATLVSGVGGWQRVSLSGPVSVNSGETVWLAWVFQNSVSVRFTTGTPSRAQSGETWTAGMPASFGGSTIGTTKFSIYCTYSTIVTSTLDVSPTTVSLAYNSGANGTFDITSNTSWTITDDAAWLDVLPVSGSNNADVTVTANSANTGSSMRTAIVSIAAYGGLNKTVTVIQEPEPVFEKTLGNTDVYTLVNASTYRRAIPVTFTEDGEIQSISIYHNGGTGNMLLGVYADNSGSPGSLLGVTPATLVSGVGGWQRVSLSGPVSVNSGETVWLAWVFQNSVSVRFTTGTPSRAQSGETWTAGMPASFGGSTIGTTKFSIYCTYSTIVTSTLDVSPTTVSLAYNSGANGTFDITSNTSWTITDDAAWLDVLPVSGSNNADVTVTANSANTGSSMRTAIVSIAAYGGLNKTVTVIQEPEPVFEKTLGNTDVYTLVNASTYRRAIPVTFTEDGEIQSISIYHNGGTGNMLLGIYADNSGSPGSLLGVTPATLVSGVGGWQRVSLSGPVSVNSGETVWLAWVFQNSVSVRFTTGTPSRAQSGETWTAGMPASFGGSTIGTTKFSIYCTYSTIVTSTLDVSPTTVSLAYNSGANGTFDITSNTSWTITDDAAWLDVLPVSGSNNADVTVTANSANTGSSMRTAIVSIAAYGGLNKTVTVIQEPEPVFEKTLGNTDVYTLVNASTYRRAIPVTFTEDGEIQSISIYHNGGTGNMLLGIYADNTGSPGSLLGVTPATLVSGVGGWQRVSLSGPVSVNSGETVWLAWVFQNSVSVRFTTGTPSRAQSGETWTAGMPASFGGSTIGTTKFSIYCNYTTESTKSAEIATAVTPDVELANLKVYPNPFSERLRFEFISPVSVNVHIDLYDMTGRLVKTIFEQQIESGVNYEVEFKSETIISGMYFCRVIMGNNITNGKVVCIKE